MSRSHTVRSFEDKFLRRHGVALPPMQRCFRLRSTRTGESGEPSSERGAGLGQSLARRMQDLTE